MRPALAREGQGRGRSAGAAGREFPGEGSSSPSPGECGSTRVPSQGSTPANPSAFTAPEYRVGSEGHSREGSPIPLTGYRAPEVPLPPALSSGRVPVLARCHPFRGLYSLISPFLARTRPSFAPRVHSRGSSRLSQLLPRPPLAGEVAGDPPPPTQTLISGGGQSSGFTPLPWIPPESPGFPNLGDSAPGRCYGRHFHSVPGGQRGGRSPVAGQHGERPQPGVS